MASPAPSGGAAGRTARRRYLYPIGQTFYRLGRFYLHLRRSLRDYRRMDAGAEQLVLDYLSELGDAAQRVLHPDERVQFMARSRVAIARQIGEQRPSGSVDVLRLLGEYGDPRKLVAAERRRLDDTLAGRQFPRLPRPHAPSRAGPGSRADSAAPGEHGGSGQAGSVSSVDSAPPPHSVPSAKAVPPVDSVPPANAERAADPPSVGAGSPADPGQLDAGESPAWASTPAGVNGTGWPRPSASGGRRGEPDAEQPDTGQPDTGQRELERSGSDRSESRSLGLAGPDDDSGAERPGPGWSRPGGSGPETRGPAGRGDDRRAGPERAVASVGQDAGPVTGVPGPGAGESGPRPGWRSLVSGGRGGGTGSGWSVLAGAVRRGGNPGETCPRDEAGGSVG